MVDKAATSEYATAKKPPSETEISSTSSVEEKATSVSTLLQFADSFDYMLLVIGIFGEIVAGAGLPLMIVYAASGHSHGAICPPAKTTPLSC